MIFISYRSQCEFAEKDMSFLVKEVSETSVKLCNISQSVESLQYPPLPSDNKEIITSFLAIFHFEKDDEFWDKMLAMFGHSSPEYKIVIHQESNHLDALEFVLYESNDLSKCQEAFKQLNSSLGHLLNDGSVRLSQGLLELLVLPTPQNPCNILDDLIHMMETNPYAHPEWHTVVQVLLHSACTRDDRTQVELLVKKGGDLKKPNNSGSTPISHYSFQEGRKWILSIIQGDVEEVKKMSSIRSFLAHNTAVPLLIGVPEDSESLLNVEEDVHESIKIWENIKAFEKPQHKRQRRVSSDNVFFIRRKSKQLDICDEHGLTPLMMSIEKHYEKSTLYLLLGGGDPNYIHRRTGDTPLHYAVKTGNPTLVKMLLVFNADASLRNFSDQTPLEVANQLNGKHMKKIVAVLKEISIKQEKTRKYFEKHNQQPIPRNSSDTYLLSMDGGGTKVFNSLQILVAIENRMRQLCPSCDSISSFFDYIAGTSSGAITALFLAYTDITPHTGRAFVYKFITDVFEKPMAERATRINDLLKDVLGENTVMADLEEQRVIVLTTLANYSPCKLHLMTSYGDARDKQIGPKERKIWEAARASSAAPYYFPSYQNRFLDGGLMANNPTLDAMVEIFSQGKKDHNDVKLGCVLSLGNGVPPEELNDNIEVFLPGYTLKTIANIHETMMGLGSLFRLFISQVTQSDGCQIHQARSWCESIDTPYYRFSPPLVEDIDPSTTSMDIIMNMLFHTQMYILDRPEEIDNIAKRLLSK